MLAGCLVGRSVGQSVSRSVGQSVSQSVSPSVRPSASLSVSASVLFCLLCLSLRTTSVYGVQGVSLTLEPDWQQVKATCTFRVINRPRFT